MSKRIKDETTHSEEEKLQQEKLKIETIKYEEDKEERIEKERELEREARRLAQKEEAASLIERLIGLNPIYTSEELSLFSVYGLREQILKELKAQEIQKEKEEEEERRREAEKKALIFYNNYKNLVEAEILNGCIIASDGSRILVRNLTEYCVILLENATTIPIISNKNLVRYSYAFARSFGQSGAQLFAKVGKYSPGQDYWSLISFYKNCLSKVDENHIDIKEFWEFCFSLEVSNEVLVNKLNMAA
jgi:hypothetical protein